MELSDKQRDILWNYVLSSETERLSGDATAINEVVRLGYTGLDNMSDEQLIDEAEAYLDYDMNDDSDTEEARQIIAGRNFDKEVHKTLEEDK